MIETLQFFLIEIGIIIVVSALVFYPPYSFYAKWKNLVIAVLLIYFLITPALAALFDILGAVTFASGAFHIGLVVGLLTRGIVACKKQQPCKWYFYWMLPYIVINVVMVGLLAVFFFSGGLMR